MSDQRDSLENPRLSTDEYREGPLGFGTLGHTWRDKPHRLVYDLCDEVDALRETVKSLVVAAGRMRDGWAEGDDAYRNQLWQALHTAADDADDRHGIYPL